MRRFWLFVLALVMPLQMSWAAVHSCDDAAPAITASAVVKVAGKASHSHDESATQAQSGEAHPDACCGAAHGCHGLHNLMAPAPLEVAATQDSCRVVAHVAQHAQRQFAERHERPQWLAA